MSPHHKITETKKGFTIFVIVLGTLIAIGPFSIDMYLPSFSAMAKDFGVLESEVQLSLASYFIGIAVGQIFYGPIVDRFGKKLPLCGGLFIFTLASIACYFATSIQQIIFFRFIQALGACAGFVIPRAIVRDVFSPQESARVFSKLMLVMGIAPIIAPTIGGFMSVHLGWRSIFAFLIIFGVASIINAALFLPDTGQKDNEKKEIKIIHRYLGILKDHNFVIYCLCGGFAQGALFAYITAAPFIFIELFKVSPENFGMIFGTNALGFILVAQVNGKLLKTIPMQKVLDKALVLMALAGIGLIIVGFVATNLWHILIPLFIFIISFGVIFPNASAISLENQYAHTGSASALLGTIQFVMSAIISFLVSYFHNGNAAQSMIIIGSCGIIAFAINYFWQRKLQNNLDQSLQKNS